MFGLLALAGITLFSPASHAASADPAGERCVGLVLGGGGARGAAHIGVLKVLERERIPICRMAGTSMGAIVGGLYASGYNAAEIEAILTAIDWKDMFSDDPARIDFPMRRKNDTLRYLLDFKLGVRDGSIQLPRGVIQGQKLLSLLRRLTLHTWQVQHFDQLSIPFRAVGTDIAAGQPVVFDHGDLALAIRASMSVPAAFAPIRVDGKLMIDGGVVNNVPVDVVKAMGAHRVIVVDVGSPLLDDSQLNSPFAITMQMLDVLMKARTEQVLAGLSPDDVRISPELGDIGSASFDRSAEAVPMGAAAAEQMLPQLRELAVSEAEYAAFSARHRRLEFDPPLVSFLDVVKRRSKTAGYVERDLRGLEGKPLDALEIERQISSVFGQGNYERISWQLRERDDEVGVEVTPVDKGWGPNFLTFGLQLSDDFAGRNSYQLGAEYTMTGLNRWGGEWRTRGEIGQTTGLRTEFFQPAGDHAEFYALPYAEFRAFDQDLRVLDAVVANYRVRRFAIGADVGYEPSPHWRFYTGLVRARGDAEVLVGDAGPLNQFDETSGGVRLGYIYDTLDDADFPSHGGRSEFSLLANRSALGADGSGEVGDFMWDHAISRGKNRLLLGTRLHTVWGEAALFDGLATLGGFTNLSGFAERELLGAHSSLFRAVYYRRLGDSGQLFSVPAYLGASLETGNVFVTREQMLDFDDMIVGGSVFVGVDSPFGPVFLGFGRADTGDNSVYLNFGSLLRPRL